MKQPPKQYPFPRDKTRPITGPSYHEGMSFDEAKAAWFTYLRVVQNIRQMNLPPLNEK